VTYGVQLERLDMLFQDRPGRGTLRSGPGGINKKEKPINGHKGRKKKTKKKNEGKNIKKIKKSQHNKNTKMSTNKQKKQKNPQ